MTKATSNELGALHKAVADSITKRLTLPRYTGDGDVIPGTEGTGCSAAELAAAITFLKNNDVMADPEVDEGLQGLREALENRRKSGKDQLLQRQQEAAQAFAETQAGRGQ
jgi:hypothetical protein